MIFFFNSSCLEGALWLLLICKYHAGQFGFQGVNIFFNFKTLTVNILFILVVKEDLFSGPLIFADPKGRQGTWVNHPDPANEVIKDFEEQEWINYWLSFRPPSSPRCVLIVWMLWSYRGFHMILSLYCLQLFLFCPPASGSLGSCKFFANWEDLGPKTVVMNSLRVILQASLCNPPWRRFQIPRTMPVRPCSLYTCTYKTRNRACEYTAALRRAGSLLFHDSHACFRFVDRMLVAVRINYLFLYLCCKRSVGSSFSPSLAEI